MSPSLLHLNLYPWRVVQIKQAIKCIIMVTVIAMFVLGSGLYLYQQRIDKKTFLLQHSIKQQNKILQSQSSENGLLRAGNKLQIKHIQDINLIRKILTDHQHEISAFSFISKNLPTTIYLNKIVQEKNKIDLSGISQDEKSPGLFIKALKKTALFDSINLKKLKKDIDSSKITFSIEASLHA